MPDTRQTHQAVASDRRGADRRRGSALTSHWSYAFRGRRVGLRRDGDRRSTGAVVDRFGPDLLVLAIALFVLSACDAAFTLTLLEHGVVDEANPLMRGLVGLDIDLFVGTKLLLTGIGVVGLVAYSQVLFLGLVPLTRVMALLVAFYVLLIGYEITLLSTL